MKGLTNKIAIVTGGGSGIGAAICKRLAEEGTRVVIFDINEDNSQTVAEQISSAGGEAHVYTVDISEHEQVHQQVDAVEAALGPIDILVNNAGWDRAEYFLKTTTGFWDKIVAINLYGPLNLHHAVLQKMSARNAGKVVNIASDAGRVGSSMEAVYSFCKGGLIAFSKTMAREMARHTININVICPGPTATPLFENLAEGEQGDRLRQSMIKAVPFRRNGQPEDVPGAVCFLASEDANFITGQVLSISGGLTMVG